MDQTKTRNIFQMFTLCYLKQEKDKQKLYTASLLNHTNDLCYYGTH